MRGVRAAVSFGNPLATLKPSIFLYMRCSNSSSHLSDTRFGQLSLRRCLNVGETNKMANVAHCNFHSQGSLLAACSHDTSNAGSFETGVPASNASGSGSGLLCVGLASRAVYCP